MRKHHPLVGGRSLVSLFVCFRFLEEGLLCGFIPFSLLLGEVLRNVNFGINSGEFCCCSCRCWRIRLETSEASAHLIVFILLTIIILLSCCGLSLFVVV